MRKYVNRFVAFTLCALLFGACTNSFEDEFANVTLDQVTYCSMPVSIDSDEDSTSKTTRIEVGNIGSNRALYKWSDKDSIGVFLLNVQPKSVNSSVVGVPVEGDPSNAKFSFNAEFVDKSGNNTNVNSYKSYLDMFIYYPYNSSMVVAQTYTSGSDAGEPWHGHEYLHHNNGLVYRVPALQTMLEHEIGRQGCTQAMSRYGVCYDFMRYTGSKDDKFTMRHTNAYFRVRVTGSQYDSTATRGL